MPVNKNTDCNDSKLESSQSFPLVPSLLESASSSAANSQSLTAYDDFDFNFAPGLFLNDLYPDPSRFVRANPTQESATGGLDDDRPINFHHSPGENFNDALSPMDDYVSPELDESEMENRPRRGQPWAQFVQSCFLAVRPPNRTMKLETIQDWMVESAGFDKNDKKWKNSVRHTLSANPVRSSIEA